MSNENIISVVLQSIINKARALYTGFLAHQNCHFDPCLHVPLIMAGPGIPENVTKSDLVSLVDIFPSLCDLAGIDVPEGVDGRSLFSSTSGPRDAVFAENGFRPPSETGRHYLSEETADRFEAGLKSLRNENYLYTLNFYGEERVYSLPEENLTSISESKRNDFRQRVHEVLGDSFQPGTQEETLESTVESNLRKLGYIQ